MVSFGVVLASCFGLALAAFKEPNGSNDTTPMQLRVAYAGPTGMQVSWNTFAQLSQPTVYYGLSSSSLSQHASSNISITYPTSTTYNNRVKITGLQPDTMYYFLPQSSNSSTPLSFKTSRAAGDTTPYTIAVVVDMGTMGSVSPPKLFFGLLADLRRTVLLRTSAPERPIPLHLAKTIPFSH